jgi:hypothetical protein
MHDQPAIIIERENFRQLEWYKNGLLSRDYDKPAYIIYNFQDQYSYPKTKMWFKNGKIERSDGKVPIIEYKYFDIPHRSDGICYIISFIQKGSDYISHTETGKPSEIEMLEPLIASNGTKIYGKKLFGNEMISIKVILVIHL